MKAPNFVVVLKDGQDVLDRLSPKERLRFSKCEQWMEGGVRKCAVWLYPERQMRRARDYGHEADRPEPRRKRDYRPRKRGRYDER